MPLEPFSPDGVNQVMRFSRIREKPQIGAKRKGKAMTTISRPYSDAELFARITRTDQARFLYRVVVSGRMSESAAYTVNAANKEEAKVIAREYASRIDLMTFRYTTWPRIFSIARTA